LTVRLMTSMLMSLERSLSCLPITQSSMKSLERIVELGMKVPYTKRNPMAQDLRQPKYKQQVIPNKKKPVPKRKQKHKGVES